MPSLRSSTLLKKREQSPKKHVSEEKASPAKYQKVAKESENTEESQGLNLKEENDGRNDTESQHNSKERMNEVENLEKRDDQLSSYELERLANIERNQNFFKQLNLNEAKDNLGLSVGQVSKVTKTFGLKREKKQKEPPPARRASKRIRRLDPLGVPLPELPQSEQQTLSQQFREVHYYHKPLSRYGLHGVGTENKSPQNSPRKPSGPFEMASFNDIDEDVCRSNIHQWSNLSLQYFKAQSTSKTTARDKDFGQYCQDIKAMTVADNHAVKIVPDRIFSLTFHPMENKQLILAGGKWGKLGIWDVDSEEGHDGVFLFEPHSRPINVISVCPFDFAKVYSCSYDGTLRCGDLEKQLFTQIYAEPEDEDVSLNAFAWPAGSSKTVAVCKNDYSVGIIDIRTGKEEKNFVAHGKLVRWIDCHPLNEHLIATSCQDGSVATWDLRVTQNIKSKLSEIRCGRVASSVFFSPKTGNKILTTSLDDTIRVYDVNANGNIDSPGKCIIKHNNQTGRWLTKFRATWDPKTDDCFVVGSMMRPRAIDFYTSDGRGSKITQLSHENLSSITSLNVFHPTLNIVAGGNSSGKVFLWK